MKPASGNHLSTLERLPNEVLQVVWVAVPDSSTQICLALASKSLLAAARPLSWDMAHAYDRSKDSYYVNKVAPSESPWGDEQTYDPWFRPLAHLAFMFQLKDWMPANLKFCTHCLYWLPSMHFMIDERRLDLNEYVELCMDCLSLDKKWFPESGTLPGKNCDGCAVWTGFQQIQALRCKDE
jgi:hypothetical protein